MMAVYLHRCILEAQFNCKIGYGKAPNHIVDYWIEDFTMRRVKNSLSVES